jgi:hypothetical protein
MVNVAPTLVHTPVAVYVTGKPELAVAATLKLERYAALVGAWVVTEMLWVPFPTVNVCCICGAGAQLIFPGWFAFSTQFPTPMNETTPALMEQTELAVPSTVITTGKPEVAVALGIYVGPW